VPKQLFAFEDQIMVVYHTMADSDQFVDLNESISNDFKVGWEKG